MCGARTTTARHIRTRASSTTSPTNAPRWCASTCRPDANTLLSVADHCLRSRQYVNVIVAGKQPALTYLTMDEAVAHCTRGLGIWEWAQHHDRGTRRGARVRGRHPDARDRGRRRHPAPHASRPAGPGGQRCRHHASATGVRTPPRAVRPRVRLDLHHATNRSSSPITATRGSSTGSTYRHTNHDQLHVAGSRSGARRRHAVRHGDAQRPGPLPPGHGRDRPGRGAGTPCRRAASGDGRRPARRPPATPANTARTIQRSRNWTWTAVDRPSVTWVIAPRRYDWQVMSDQSAVAAHPHPLVAQLSALHHFRIYADIGIVVVILTLDQPDRALHHPLGEHRHRPGRGDRPADPGAGPRPGLGRAGTGPRTLALRRRLRAGGGGPGGLGDRHRGDAAVDPADVHERQLRHHLRCAARVDGDHPAPDGDPRGVRVPRRAARSPEPGLGFRGVAAAGSLLFGLWHIASSLGFDE